jgi:hypothetical protein
MVGTGRRRIHIIGGPGSGKTSLACQLGGYLNIPFHQLDLIAFEGPDFHERPLEQRLADVHRIAAESAWITEGIFVSWTDELLQAAELIVWLDHVSWRIAIWRIVVRFARLGIKEVRHQQGLRKFTRFQDYARHLRQLAGVFYSSRLYYSSQPTEGSAQAASISRSATAAQLAPYMDKVVHCRSTNDIQRLINSIVNQNGQTRPANT